MSRQQSRIKKTKITNSKNKVIFRSKYNPVGPNIKSIIQKHSRILDNYQIMQNKEIMVPYKGEKNLKELLTRADPIIALVMLMMKCTRVLLVNKGAIHVKTLWSQKVVSNVWLQKEFTYLDGLPLAFPKM